MDINEYIFAALSDGSRSWTDLMQEIVPKICAKGTLSKHLKDLENEGRIKRALHDDRTTTYTLMSEMFDNARSSKDLVTLESLIRELGHKTRKDLQLEELKTNEKKDLIQDLQRAIGPTRNYPRMNFGMQLDENTLRIVNLVYSTSELADELEKTIRNKLNKIKQEMPSTIKNEWKEFVSQPMDWHDATDFSSKIALKHGLRFLVFSWYDGANYKNKLLSAINNLKKLERGHEEDISFLDEVNRRCYYSSLEYYYEGPAVFEETLMDHILNISDPYQLLENAFLLHHGEGALMWLEAALVSEGVSKQLSKSILKKELAKGAIETIQSPYDIIALEDYIRMKLPLIEMNSRKSLVKILLGAFSQFLMGEGKMFSRDYQLHPDDYHQAIEILKEKLGIDEKLGKDAIMSPVFNFVFRDEKRKVDFSKETLVENFLSFLGDPKKKKWLQKCLSLGIPIFPSIPFNELGFKMKSIL